MARWFVILVALCAFACQGNSGEEAEGGAGNEPGAAADGEAAPNAGAKKDNAAASDNPAPEAAADDPSVALPERPASTLSLSAELSAHGAWLPGDMVGAASIDQTAVRSDIMGMAQMLLPTFTQDKQEALRADLVTLISGELGFDPLGATSATIAVGGDWVTVLLGGGIELSGLPTKSIAGQTVHVAKEKALFLPLPSGNAVAMFPRDKALESFIAAQKAGTLEKAPMMAKLKPALEAVGPGVVTVVVNLQHPMIVDALRDELGRDLKKLTQKDNLEGFDFALLRANADTIRMSVIGDPAVLGKVNDTLSGLLKKFAGEVQVAKTQVETMDFEEAMAVTTAYHLLGPAGDALMPRLEGNAMVMELPSVGGGVLISAVGVMAAIAVPAFTQYINDSKTSEAQENLKMIGDGAMMYFESEHMADPSGLQVVTKVYPLAKDWVCTDGAEPNSTKVVPKPDAFSGEPWKSLRFAISKPHYFRYCYKSSADQKAFAAIAEAALSSDEVDTIFCINGNEDFGNPILGFPLEIESRDMCENF